MKISHITRKLTATTMLAAFLVFGSFGASADFIEGAISMSGDFLPTGGTGTLGTATGLSFPGNDFHVDGVTGDLDTTIDVGDIGAYTDFTFNPLPGPGVDPLWAIGGFQFALQSISIDFQNPSFDLLLLSGTGILSGNGFEATTGTWDFSGNSAGLSFNFTAGSVAAPEPGSLALLGIGLLGMAMRRSFKKQN